MEFGVNKTGLIAKISIKYVLPTCIWKYFWRISRYFAFFWEFRGISRKYLNFAGPRPREISEALIIIITSSNQRLWCVALRNYALHKKNQYFPDQAINLKGYHKRKRFIAERADPFHSNEG